MIIRENYFGMFTNFSTLGEYIRKRKDGRVGDDVVYKYREGKVNPLGRLCSELHWCHQANVFEVLLDVTVKNGLLVLPAGIPGYEVIENSRHRNVPLESIDPAPGLRLTLLASFDELQLLLRTHDYFMGMSYRIRVWHSITQILAEMSLNVSPLVMSLVEECLDEQILGANRSGQESILVIEGAIPTCLPNAF